VSKVVAYKHRALGPSEVELDWERAWCVEEREIARLKENGRRSSKKNRRVIGRAIRYWQRRLERGTRSVSVPFVFSSGQIIWDDGQPGA
jgi:hypothetical protein